MKSFLALFSILILFSACAKQIRIKSLTPAEVSEMASKKKIAVSEFRDDHIGLSGKIESKIAKHKLDNSKIFTVVNRKDLQKIIAEHKLQSSELMDEKTSTEVGKLIGAEAIINGEIAFADSKTTRQREAREKCLKYVKDEGCVRYKHYTVICESIQASVSANLNIIDVETASVIYGDTISKEYNDRSCISGGILSDSQAINRLSEEIADEFVYRLTPHYNYFYVELLDSIELDDISDENEDMFEAAISYIEAGRMKKADEILLRLMNELHSKSYVVAYVYGVVKESLGELDDAKELYKIADNLTYEPVKEINRALIRIEKLIDEKKELGRYMDAK